MFNIFFLVFSLIFTICAHAQPFPERIDNQPKVADPKAAPIATLCPIVSFGAPKDLKSPLWPETGKLAEGPDHNIYGTTPVGGEKGFGTIYKVTPDGSLTVLHEFNFTDGAFSKSGLTTDGNGTFYGTCYSGGEHGVGTIFSMSSNGTPNTMYNFRNGKPKRVLRPGEKDYTEQEKLDWGGSYPISAPVIAGGGLYGVSSYSNNQKYGILYSISGDYHGIERFAGDKGNYGMSLSAGKDGHLYGAALGTVGKYPLGIIFGADGGINPIHIFKVGADDGASPFSVTVGSDGNIYGTTIQGGIGDRGAGVIYRLSPGGDFTILHKFNISDGYAPFNAPIEGADGALYGAARYGGFFGRGVTYKIDKDGKNFKVLESFEMGVTGRSPMGQLLLHSNGNFYGTTYEGGRFGKGVVYRLNIHPTKPDNLVAPGRRWCCSLGQGRVVTTLGGQSLDPSELSGHIYGLTHTTAMASNIQKDPIGFVYTRFAGLIDIAHLRDMADMTKYIYDMIVAGETMFDLYEGHVMITKFPDDQYKALQLAGAIAYVEGWAHELETLGTDQDLSAFSPEDLVSNLVGIEVAKRAITYDCEKDFSKAVDIEMAAVMKELDAQSVATTDEARSKIERHTLEDPKDKWFERAYGEGSNYGERLIRRNFDGSPWKILPDKDRYIPLWFRKGWLLLEYSNFRYFMGPPVAGREGVTLSNMQSATEFLRKQWTTAHPGMDWWPYNR
jgi:uncharacterized repeat protein (TIGR03803 family)